MNIAARRPLENVRIGISVSEGDDTLDLGITPEELNRCIVRLSETLLGFGARLVFGHDWRYGGVMEAISQAALRYWPVDDANTPPLIKNFVPWPDTPQLEPDVQRRIERLIKIERAGLPEDLPAWSKVAEISASGRDVVERICARERRSAIPADALPEEERTALRAFGLTHLRHRLTDSRPHLAIGQGLRIIADWNKMSCSDYGMDANLTTSSC